MKSLLKQISWCTIPFTLFSMSITPALCEEVEWFGDPIFDRDNSVQVDVLLSDQSETKLTFDFSGVELYSAPGRTGNEAEIPHEGHTAMEGVPSLPKVSRLIAVPARARVSLSYEYSDLMVMENVQLLPTMELPVRDIDPDVELSFDQEIYTSNSLFPGELVEIGRPAIMKDLRVVRVTVNPARYNPVEGTLTLYKHVEITLHYESGGTVNTLSAEPAKFARSYERLYESYVANFGLLDLELDEEMGSLLIIAPNNPTVLAQVQDLVDWKNRKGFNTVLANLSQTGSTSSQIKAYIQNAYDTWEPQLSYLILIGDCAGSIAVPASNSYGDHDYSRLDGDDILADIAVGRFSCANTTQLLTEINKVIEYEAYPNAYTSFGYKKAAVVAGSSSSGISTIQTKRGIRTKALLNGYTAVDTLWYSMTGSVPTFTNNCINLGIGFYNYRGYVGMSGYSLADINLLTNYHRLPFVVTITCGTGDITGSDSDYTEEFFRVGTPNNPTGAIAAIGTATTGTNTRCNNCVDNGIFGAFFDYEIFRFGDALNVGKFDLYMSFPDDPSLVTNFSNWNNLIGDPTCMLWTDIPKAMIASYPDVIPAGTSFLTVTMTDSSSGLPLDGVDVCLNGTGFNLLSQTDETGEAHFNLPYLTINNFQLTSTLHNYKPHLGTVSIVTEDVYLSYFIVDVDDDNIGVSNGNDNGMINPGETIELGISLKNYGSSITATGIVAVLSSESELVGIIDSTHNYSNLPPAQFSPVEYGFAFSVDQSVVNDFNLPLNLNVTSGQGSWDSPLLLTVHAPDIVFQTHLVLDPNGQLDPGEQAELSVTLMNVGRYMGNDLQAVLQCEDENISIIQGTSSYGIIGTGQSSSGAPFLVEASPLIIPGSSIQFELFISGANGYTDTTDFELVVGDVMEYNPTGPDEYGYYALDDTDYGYLERPDYDWVEIDPFVPGHQYTGSSVGLTDYGYQQDDTELVNLPFDFAYYGQSFSQIAVCSNGWLAFGEMSSYTNFRNWYIPSTLGPYSLVAPFWDDLYLSVSPVKIVYHYFDNANHRYIVEWNVKNYGSNNPDEKFEVILYDPAHYPTATGDGIITFQYAEISNIMGVSTDNHYATVGIKSNDNLTGIQYSYWNYYAEGAAPLTNCRAIKFTTDEPTILIAPNINFESLIIYDQNGNNNYQLDPGETADFHITLINNGTLPATNIRVVIESDEFLITVPADTAVIDELQPSAEAVIIYSGITADPSMPLASSVEFSLTITADEGYFAEDEFSIAVGDERYLPSGPDGYGYRIFDMYDGFGAPVYDWIEINPSVGGAGTIITLGDDQTGHVDLPFDFGYYGTNYDELSICSNGWVAPGYNTSTAYSNVGIPTGASPNNMIAAFWDDLNPGVGGQICWYNDVQNHRFIVEYYHVPHYSSTGQLETFQIIFYDPEFFPTITGDGEIQVNYHTLTSESSMTAGFENTGGTDGLQYLYNGLYDIHAMPLESTFSFKITTNSGISELAITLEPHNIPIIIPAAGGTFEYDLTINNIGASTIVFSCWTDVILPDSTLYGPILLRTGLTLTPGNSISRTMTQSVPMGAPAGNYTYFGHAGEYPQYIIDEDRFQFEKAAGENVAGSDYADWNISGWNEDAIGIEPAIPETFFLAQNYPNPFNNKTTINFGLPESCPVNLTVYNILGRKADVLVDATWEAGYHTVSWNTSKMASGVYFYHLQAGEFSRINKCVLMK